MYKYVFLDLDGTITEPEEGIINGVLYALSKFGITVEDRTASGNYRGQGCICLCNRLWWYDRGNLKDGIW